jgi:hypothetical protein
MAKYHGDHLIEDETRYNLDITKQVNDEGEVRFVVTATRSPRPYTHSTPWVDEYGALRALTGILGGLYKIGGN